MLPWGNRLSSSACPLDTVGRCALPGAQTSEAAIKQGEPIDRHDQVDLAIRVALARVGDILASKHLAEMGVTWYRVC